jgi:hypothetical protein
MKRICLIGTSHLAALKHGSALVDMDGKAEFRYFGCGAGSFRGARYSDGAMVPITRNMRTRFAHISGGLDRIHVRDFDAFAVVGFAGFSTAISVATSYRTMEFQSRRNQPLLSRPLFEKVIECSIEKEIGVDMARTLAKVADAPVVVLAKPRTAHIELSTNTRLQRLKESGDGMRLGEIYATILAELSHDGVQFLDQPNDTIVDFIVTADEFSTGSKRLGNGEALSEQDTRHMNSAYGAKVLMQLLSHLGVHTPVLTVTSHASRDVLASDSRKLEFS